MYQYIRPIKLSNEPFAKILIDTFVYFGKASNDDWYSFAEEF